MSHWSAPFIGIPHSETGHARDGSHCWGLIVLVFRDVLNIELPTYEGRFVSLEEQAEIAALVKGESTSPAWSAVSDAKPFDVVLFRQGRYATHVGLVVEPGRMLHVSAGMQSKIENYSSPVWRHRLAGTYRHVRCA